MAVALPFLAVAFIGLGAITSIAGGYQQRKQAQQQHQYNAQVADNQVIAAKNAEAVEIRKFDRKDRFRAGRQRARAGASGVLLEGTPLDLISDSEVQAQFERDIIRYNGELGAIGAKTKAIQSRNKADNAYTGFGYEAAGTLLTAGAEILG